MPRLDVYDVRIKKDEGHDGTRWHTGRIYGEGGRIR